MSRQEEEDDGGDPRETRTEGRRLDQVFLLFLSLLSPPSLPCSLAYRGTSSSLVVLACHSFIHSVLSCVESRRDFQTAPVFVSLPVPAWLADCFGSVGRFCVGFSSVCSSSLLVARGRFSQIRDSEIKNTGGDENMAAYFVISVYL